MTTQSAALPCVEKSTEDEILEVLKIIKPDSWFVFRKELQLKIFKNSRKHHYLTINFFDEYKDSWFIESCPCDKCEDLANKFRQGTVSTGEWE